MAEAVEAHRRRRRRRSVWVRQIPQLFSESCLRQNLKLQPKTRAATCPRKLSKVVKSELPCTNSGPMKDGAVVVPLRSNDKLRYTVTVTYM